MTLKEILIIAGLTCMTFGLTINIVNWQREIAKVTEVGLGEDQSRESLWRTLFKRSLILVVLYAAGYLLGYLGMLLYRCLTQD